jgi:adenine-specific DNA-methyltransferase
METEKRGMLVLPGADDSQAGSSAPSEQIDKAQWASLYSSKSYPFAPPASGKIAVKVINHYGDEVLKVYKV